MVVGVSSPGKARIEACLCGQLEHWGGTLSLEHSLFLQWQKQACSLSEGRCHPTPQGCSLQTQPWDVAWGKLSQGLALQERPAQMRRDAQGPCTLPPTTAPTLEGPEPSIAQRGKHSHFPATLGAFNKDPYPQKTLTSLDSKPAKFLISKQLIPKSECNLRNCLILLSFAIHYDWLKTAKDSGHERSY